MAALGLTFTPAALGVEPEFEVIDARPDSAWDQRFERPDGWIGGDCAYSLLLPDSQVIWFFGDTLLGKVTAGTRGGARMINNSVGVQPSALNPGPLEYFWPGEAQDQPRAVFVPADHKGWFWPQAPLQIGGRLYLFLSQIEKSNEPGVFGFRPIAQWLGRIENPTDPPRQWRVGQRKLPFAEFGVTSGNADRSFGSAVCQAGDDVFVFGYQEQEKGPSKKQLIVARAPRDDFENFSSWRFRSAAGWSQQPERCLSLADGLAAEFSVSRLAEGGPWLLVYTDAGLGEKIVARTAPAPDGPWSAPRLLFTCPESGRDPGVFCYAAKLHECYSKPEQLLISYCVNTWEFDALFRSNRYYRPKFVNVSIRWPEPPAK